MQCRSDVKTQGQKYIGSGALYKAVCRQALSLRELLVAVASRVMRSAFGNWRPITSTERPRQARATLPPVQFTCAATLVSFVWKDEHDSSRPAFCGSIPARLGRTHSSRRADSAPIYTSPDFNSTTKYARPILMNSFPICSALNLVFIPLIKSISTGAQTYWHPCQGVRLASNPNDCPACISYFQEVTQKLESKTQTLEMRFSHKGFDVIKPVTPVSASPTAPMPLHNRTFNAEVPDKAPGNTCTAFDDRSITSMQPRSHPRTHRLDLLMVLSQLIKLLNQQRKIRKNERTLVVIKINISPRNISSNISNKRKASESVL